MSNIAFILSTPVQLILYNDTHTRLQTHGLITNYIPVKYDIVFEN